MVHLFFIALLNDNKWDRVLKERSWRHLKCYCGMKEPRNEVRNLFKSSGTRTEHETRGMQSKRGGHWSATFGRVNYMFEVTGMENKHIIYAMFHITALFKKRLFSGRKDELRRIRSGM
jgi:hypothetical protein